MKSFPDRWNSLTSSRSGLAALVVGLTGAGLLALLSRTVIGHQPLYDELLHMLSARSLVSQGVPAIGDGLYSRAMLFTRLVALSLEALGDTLVAARIPSLVAAALLVFGTGFWMTRRLGVLAGLVSAVLLCLLPGTVRLAVFVRFYTLHALVILVIGVLAFAALRPGASRMHRVALAAAALLLVPLGWHLQPSTAIAVVAIGAGVMAVLCMDHWSIVSEFIRRRPMACAAALVVLTVVGLVLVDRLGLYAMLREVPLWAAWAADKPGYYLQRFADDMPLLWPIFPVATVLAFHVDRRLALFCLGIVIAGLVVHSIAAAKEMRYVYYLLPFLCAILGMGFAGAVSTVSGWRPVLVTGLLALVLGLSVEGQGAAKLLLGKARMIDVLPYTIEPDWTPAAAELRAAAATADRVVTSNSMKAMYYIGGYDYEVNASILAETDTRADFGVDVRTGRQVVGSAAATETLIGMPGATLFVLEEETLNRESGVSESVVATLQARCTRLPLVSDVALQLWRCE